MLLAFLYEDMDNEHELLKSEWEYKRLMSISGEALFMVRMHTHAAHEHSRPRSCHRPGFVVCSLNSNCSLRT